MDENENQMKPKANVAAMDDSKELLNPAFPKENGIEQVHAQCCGGFQKSGVYVVL